MFIGTLCPECGSIIYGNDSTKIDICPRCGTPFIVTEAQSSFVRQKELGKLNISDDNIYRGNIETTFDIDEYKTLRKCTGVGNVIIPYGVRAIGSHAFSDSSFLSVKLPDTVTTIGKDALFFARLIRLELPESVVLIEDDAFRYSGIKHVYLPKSLRCIGKCAFADVHLDKIKIPGNVQLGYGAFIGSTIHELDLEEGIKIISDSCFWGCKNLESVKIPRSVEHIERCAFRDCTNLKKVEVLSPNTIIDSPDAFLGFWNVETIIADPKWIDKYKKCFKKYSKKWPWSR